MSGLGRCRNSSTSPSPMRCWRRQRTDGSDTRRNSGEKRAKGKRGMRRGLEGFRVRASGGLSTAGRFMQKESISRTGSYTKII